MITWMRPSGTPITTNDNPATIEYAESLKWTREDDTPVEETTQRKRRPNAEMTADGDS